MSTIETRRYQIRFSTPAFLGNAEQSGQWRTPPFKALLRQWWRVAWAEENRFSLDIDSMRTQEGELFGSAADGSGNRSNLRLRLSSWEKGSLKKQQWTELPKVTHPEVNFPIDAGLYMAYGPVSLQKGKGKRTPVLNANAALQFGESATLSLAYPEEGEKLISSTVDLIHLYSSLGGRSRNGWGSLEMIAIDDGWDEKLARKPPLRDWQKCMDRDWPHAIGSDKSGVALIWKTDIFGDWQTLMKCLAEIKIGLRTQFGFNSGHGSPQPEKRHWLSYPVTNHSVKSWGSARLPNSLRFKVRRNVDESLYGVVFHVPCLPPEGFRPDRDAIIDIWQQVHHYLDNLKKLRRISRGEY